MEPIWASLLARALQGKNIKDLLSDVRSSNNASVSGASSAAVVSIAAETSHEEESEEEEEDDVSVSLLIQLS